MNDWMAGAPADGFDVLLSAEVDKTQPFVGEQVILTYLILTQQPIYGVAIEEQADLNHFLTEAISLAERPSPQPVNVRGRVYQSFPIKRTALYPLVAKELTIPPLTVAIDIATPRPDSAAVSTTIYRPSNPVTIVARPLPVAGRPRDFSGAVGNYQISMETYKDRMRTGEPAELTLRVRGRGNVSALSLPPLPTAEQFKFYPAKLVNSRFGLITSLGDDLKVIGYGGEKAWSLMIVPKTTGDITVEPVEISFFNPETGRYHSARSEPVTFHVDRSPPVGMLASQGTIAAPERRTVRVIAVWMLLLVLVLLVGAFYYLSIFGRILSSQKRASAEGRKQSVASYMAEARAVLPNPKSKTFFDLVAEGLKGRLESKLQISLASLTVTEIKARIAEKGIATEDAEEVARILETCDRARFATASLPMSLREELYEDTVKLTKKL